MNDQPVVTVTYRHAKRGVEHTFPATEDVRRQILSNVGFVQVSGPTYVPASTALSEFDLPRTVEFSDGMFDDDEEIVLTDGQLTNSPNATPPELALLPDQIANGPEAKGRTRRG